MISSNSFLFMYPISIGKTLAEVETGLRPREHSSGYIQLKEKGFDVQISDERWNGRLGSIRKKMLSYFEIPSLNTIKRWRTVDTIIVKDRLSITLSLLALILRKKNNLP